MNNTEAVKYFLLGIVITYLLIEVKDACWIKSNSKKLLDDKIKILVRQTARWSTAADQDKSPLIKLLHANYGAGYLWALKDIANNKQIEQAAGIDMNEFQKSVVDARDRATKAVINICPSFAPPPSYLTAIGGEG